MADVTVIVPTFNRRAMVREAVRSVRAQSGAEYELIVVDDGSEDGTAEALRAEFGPALCVLRTEHRGVAAARNAGAGAARTPWLAFLDSDDLWRPHKLGAQLRFLAAHPEMRICQTEEIWWRNGVRVNPGRRHRKQGGDIFLASLRLCLVSPSAVMMCRGLFAALGGFDENLPVCEDYDLWLRVACTTAVGLMPEPLVIKRGGHADQLSRCYWGMDRFRVAALLKLLSGGWQLPAARRQAVIEVMAEKCEILAAGAAKRGRTGEAQRYRMLAARYGGAGAVAGMKAGLSAIIRRVDVPTP